MLSILAEPRPLRIDPDGRNWPEGRDLNANRMSFQMTLQIATAFALGLRRVAAGLGAAAALMAIGAVCWLAPGAAQARPQLIEQKESIYNSIYIYEDAPFVTMVFGKNRRLYTESKVNTNDPLELPVAYTRFMTVGMAYPETVKRVLEIGVGGGSTISYLARTYPDIEIEAAELDGAVLDYARKYFHVEENDRVRLFERDGRIFLLRSDGDYDVALIDAYRGPFVPFHLLTKEFYQLVSDRLSPGGVVLQNVDPSTMLFDGAIATINSVFETVEVYRASGNYVILAHHGPRKTDAELQARAEALDAEHKPRYSLVEMIQDRAPPKYSGGQVLTDDFAPVEALKATQRHNLPDGPGQ